MKKKLVIIPVVIVLLAIVFQWQIKGKINTNIKHINGLLYDLNIEMDILEYLLKNHSEDKFIKERMTHLLVNKMLILSKNNPPIEKLRGTPLQALNRLITYNKKSPIDFSLGQSVELSKGIEIYLKKIEDKVTSEIKKRKIILEDPLKQEFKEKLQDH